MLLHGTVTLAGRYRVVDALACALLRYPAIFILFSDTHNLVPGCEARGEGGTNIAGGESMPGRSARESARMTPGSAAYALVP
jgi:hypothetical protein